MSDGEWEILEIAVGEEGLTLRVPAANHHQPVPGQYFLATAMGLAETLATSVYFLAVEDAIWSLAGDFPRSWQPGMYLQWRGPLGKGFHLPEGARKVALASTGTFPVALPAMVSRALQQNASVVWYRDSLAPNLPPSVEVLPIESLMEVWIWADYLALECDIRSLDELVHAIGLEKPKRLPFPVQVLIRTPLICGGMADCGVCAVKTKSGWKLACKDGPVFNLQELDLAV